MPRHLRHHQSFKRSIRREAQHRAVSQQIFARYFPSEINFHHRRQLNPTCTNRPEVLSLSRNQRGRGQERYVRDRIVDITPENITAHKQSLIQLVETNPRLATREPLRAQISVRVGHDISHTKVAVELVECRRAKGAIRRRTHFNTFIETLRQPQTRAKRSLRPIGKHTQRRTANHRRAIRETATIEPMVDSTSEAKLPRSDVHRITRKNSDRSLPSTRIDKSRDS